MDKEKLSKQFEEIIKSEYCNTRKAEELMYAMIAMRDSKKFSDKEMREYCDDYLDVVSESYDVDRGNAQIKLQLYGFYTAC